MKAISHQWKAGIPAHQLIKPIFSSRLMSVRRVSCHLFCALFALGIQSFPAKTFAEGPVGLASLADLSLQELADIEITSLGKKPISLSQAPASLFVITNRDIRRSGATTLPEALRLAPNLLVAQIDSNQYAISARGLNGSVANKLQVLIDGRIVYTPLYSGVLWNAQDVMLEDIERIEIISGPEDASWGANSVNGVINIITRDSADTQGGLLSARASGDDQHAAFRYGSALNHNTHLRVHAKFDQTDAYPLESGGDNEDDWDRGQIGFRLDQDRGSDHVQVQGSLYQSTVAEDTNGQSENSGGHLLAEWRHDLNVGGNIRVLTYLDYSELDFDGVLNEKLTTSYVEFQHVLQRMGNHSLLWGVDYRYAQDRIENISALAFLPEDKNLSWGSIYGQDTIQLTDQFQLTLSGRVEHNEYSGTEFMPSARLAYHLNRDNLLWTAISRAVRTPSRIDKEFFFPQTAPFLLSGGPNFDSEKAWVYQLGYRALFSSRATFNITFFLADYENLRGIESLPDTSLAVANVAKGEVSGLESWGTLQMTDRWRLSGGVLLLDRDLKIKDQFLLDSNPIVSGQAPEGNDPSSQWLLRSEYDFGEDKELDISVRRVGGLSNSDISSYFAVDARLAWWLSPAVELSLSGRNLLDDKHVEFASSGSNVEIERKVLLGLRWNF